MNYIKKVTLLVLGTLFLGISFHSCTENEPEILTPKAVNEYLKFYTEFYKSEKAFVDSCKIGYNKGDFTPVSTTSFAKYKTAYLAVLRNDSAVLFNPNVTIAQIIAANIALNNDTSKTPIVLLAAGKNFRGKINISDRRALNDSIIAATALNTSIVVGTAIGNVLQNDKTTFAAAIIAATATRDAAASVDRQVKAAIDALLAAKKVFLAAIIPTVETYKSKANTYLIAEKALLEKTPAGYNVGECSATAKATYQTALLASEAVVTKSGATITEIAASLQTLVTPRKTFLDSRSTVDRRSLRDTIAADSTLNANLIVGTTKGLTPQVLKTTFATAITAAKTILNTSYPIDTTATKAVQITSKEVAKQNMVKAIYNLGAAKMTLSIGITLSDSIIDCETLNASVSSGNSAGQVTVAVKANFTSVIAAAKKTRDYVATTSTQMTTAINVLSAAKMVFTQAIKK